MVRVIVDYAPAVLAWAAVVYKLPGLRARFREPALQAICLTLVLIALATTTGLPHVYRAIDIVTGVPNIAKLLIYSLGVLVAWSVQNYYCYLGNPANRAAKMIQRRSIAVTATLVTMASLFAVASVDQTEPLHFGARYGEQPAVLGFQTLMLAYTGWAMWKAAIHPWRYARLMGDHPATQLGIRLTAVAAMAGVVYTLERGLYGVGRILGLGYPFGDPEMPADLLKGIVVAFAITGLTMPAWGPRVGIPELCRWAARYRACQSTYALWSDLCRLRPEIALRSPRSRPIEALDIRDMHFRLYRRRIEIHDGCKGLWLDPAVGEHARGLCEGSGMSPEDVQAIADAATLAVAITFGRHPPIAARSERRSGAHIAHTSRSSISAPVEKVSRYYEHSDIVHKTTSHFLAPGTRGTAASRLT